MGKHICLVLIGCFLLNIGVSLAADTQATKPKGLSLDEVKDACGNIFDEGILLDKRLQMYMDCQKETGVDLFCSKGAVSSKSWQMIFYPSEGWRGKTRDQLKEVAELIGGEHDESPSGKFAIIQKCGTGIILRLAVTGKVAAQNATQTMGPSKHLKAAVERGW